MKKIFISFFFLFLASQQMIYSQSKEPISKILKSKFENFEYENIIQISDSILKSGFKINKEDSIQIFYYRSIAAFHIWDINISEESFKILLKLDKNFILDSTEVSPKIILFFEQIKKKETEKFDELIKNQKQNNLNSSSNDNLKRSFTIFRESVEKNFIMPGWGNLFLNEKDKGYFFITTFSISLLSSIYFYFDTRSKEKAYLNEVDIEKISEKYKSYNTSYKLRNISLITSGLIYIYSQFDILSRNPFLEDNAASKVILNFSMLNQIQINLIFSF